MLAAKHRLFQTQTAAESAEAHAHRLVAAENRESCNAKMIRTMPLLQLGLYRGQRAANTTCAATLGHVYSGRGWDTADLAAAVDLQTLFPYPSVTYKNPTPKRLLPHASFQTRRLHQWQPTAK